MGEPWVPPPRIGVPRFELGTSPTRTERATRLRHTPSGDRVSLRCRLAGRGSSRVPALRLAPMAARDEIVAYANELLEIERLPEFAPQGLQVVGAAEVTTIACGVSCSRELFERAVACGARARAGAPRPLLAQRAARRRRAAPRAGSRRSSAATPRCSPITSRSTRTPSSATTPSSPHGSGATPQRPVRGRRSRLLDRRPPARGARRARREPRSAARRSCCAGGDRRDPAPRGLDRRRGLRPDPSSARGLRRAPHGRAGGAERRDRARARDPPDRRRPPRDRALRRRRRWRRIWPSGSASSGHYDRGREPGVTACRRCGHAASPEYP